MTTSPRPEVLLIGFGAVGAFYAYVLQRGGANVTTVCRSNLASVRSRGVDIVSMKLGESPHWQPTRVAGSPEDTRGIEFDYVQPSSEIIRPYLEHQQQHSSRKPAIVLIQNGVDIEAEPYEQLVRASVPLASGILSAVSWITASLVAQGSRVEHGNLERLSVGVYTPPDAQEDAALLQAAHTFVDVAARGGADASVSTDIEAQRWQKLLWNVSWGALSLLSRRPTQELVQVETLPYSMGVVRGFMEEMVSVARASGISEERLPTSSIDKTLRITLSSTPARVRLQKEPEVFLERDSAAYGSRDFRPSILVDLESQRPMELEPIFMNVLRRARRLHVDTPRLDVVAAAIKPAQLQLVRERNGEDHNALIMAEGVYDLDPQDNYTAGARLAL